MRCPLPLSSPRGSGKPAADTHSGLFTGRVIGRFDPRCCRPPDGFAPAVPNKRSFFRNISIKNPADHHRLPGCPKNHRSLPSSVAVLSRCCNSFPSQGLTHLSAAKFTRLFVTFFQFKPFEQTVVLNFLLQDPHGLFDIVVVYFDCYFLQITPPFRPPENARSPVTTPMVTAAISRP